MTAQYLNIESKHRQMTGFLASLADFSCSDGHVASAEVVRSNPNVSLYCLDDEGKRAIFVELPPDIDLTRAPFVYQTQYEHAQRLIAVPYDTFRHLAHDLPTIDHPIVIYISGRSGSTLVSHLFNAMAHVVSLSEPDVATQFVHLRRTRGEGDAALRDLLDSTVRFLFKPSAFGTRSAHALKLRNEGLQVMGLYQATFPQATNLYLYRDAIGFVASFYRIFRRFQSPEYAPVSEYLTLFGQIFNQDLTYLTAYLDEGITELSIPQLLTLWWLAGVEWYLAQHANGIPILAVRYADLNAYRERVVTEMVRYCGLPTDQVPRLLDVFATDAQAGTALARDNPEEGNQLRLRDEQLEQIARILERHSVVKTSDFVVPATLRV